VLESEVAALEEAGAAELARRLAEPAKPTRSDCFANRNVSSSISSVNSRNQLPSVVAARQVAAAAQLVEPARAIRHRPRFRR